MTNKTQQKQQQKIGKQFETFKSVESKWNVNNKEKNLAGQVQWQQRGQNLPRKCLKSAIKVPQMVIFLYLNKNTHATENKYFMYKSVQ